MAKDLRAQSDYQHAPRSPAGSPAYWERIAVLGLSGGGLRAARAALRAWGAGRRRPACAFVVFTQFRTKNRYTLFLELL
ncbi:hypothetical protein FJ418_13870 [Mesorhizobium sp. B2-8-3]|nr:hypothetical protein FJ418_13870 [Mesorhizobium sp. B2-8-3]